MRLSLTRHEAWLLAALALLAAVAVFGPAFAQPPHLNAFADQRTLWGIPHALDVLSNLPFAVAGGTGLWLLQHGWTASGESPGSQQAASGMSLAFSSHHLRAATWPRL